MSAAEQIEETIRLARHQLERQIATYRLWFFGLAVVMTSLANVPRLLNGQAADWWSPAWFSLCVGYGLALRAAVRRASDSRGLGRLAVCVDQFATVANFLLVPAAVHADVLPWAIHVAPAALMIVLLINLLRNDAVAAVLGSVAGFLACATVLVVYEGVVPQLAALAGLFGLAGVLGHAVAGRARTTLELHGRFQLLRRFLAPAAVARVVEQRPDAALELGGQLVRLTLLCSDLRGFTTMSESLEPDELVRQLNAYHGVMLAQIEAHGGALDKFIGDGMLAVFGLHLGGETDPDGDCGAAASVACARAMLTALEEHNTHRGELGLGPLRIGVGIHTGAVVAGNVGAPDRRLEFTVIGDAVNTAARLEGMTKQMDYPVLISSETAAFIGSDHGLVELPALQLRGKQAPVRAFGLAAPARVLRAAS